MISGHQTEPNLNNSLNRLLRTMMPGCQVISEVTQSIKEQTGRHCDVLVTAPGRAPVVVEAEYDPAAEVDIDARARLGVGIVGESRTVEAAIPLRYPRDLEKAYDTDEALSKSHLSYYTLHEDGSRFPESGWLEGSATDLADLIRIVSMPQKEVDQATDALEEGIDSAATILDEVDGQNPGITREIASLLGMANVPQTRRMACAILANALIFHQRIAGMHKGVKPIHLVCGPNIKDPQEETLEAWETILGIDYWPIFAIAKDMLGQLSSGDATRILNQLRLTAQRVGATGVDNANDLTGRIFQRLIADRKYLATFYTLPASAALLAGLAVAKLENFDWADARAIGQLRIGDFACGTGALLSAVYSQIVARHDRACGDAANLHRVMMEEILYGCDVMPSAVHITSSTLAGAQPNIDFGKSRIYTMPYGRQEDGSVKIGSLELLQSSSVVPLFNTSDPAMRTGSLGEETAAQIITDIPDEGFDLVIMNPPFTRNTTREGETADAVAAAFAAFDSSDADQREMAKRMGTLKAGSCYHGNAGMASAFAGLADKKLKQGGVLALVLPLSAASGLSWQGFRRMLGGEYTDLTVLSIAANGKDMSFSSDTGMAECLVIARKLRTYPKNG